MSRIIAYLSLAAILCAVGDAASTVLFSSIQPSKLNVNVSFVIDGQPVMPSSPPCSQPALGSACLPVVHALRDQVKVTYSLKDGVTANATAFVQLKACYSAFSQVNRPWRAFNNLLAKSKGCPFQIATNLSSTSGMATWKIPQQVPVATYYVRAFVYQGINPVAYGQSMGFFQVQPINTREKGLEIAAAICICVGPIVFASLMLWEFKFQKKRV